MIKSEGSFKQDRYNLTIEKHEALNNLAESVVIKDSDYEYYSESKMSIIWLIMLYPQN